MWPSARFVDENVAFSRMPTEGELDAVAREFKAVVVLVEDYELPYPLEEWEERGVEVLHSPIPDFGAPLFLSSSESSAGLKNGSGTGKRS